MYKCDKCGHTMDVVEEGQKCPNCDGVMKKEEATAPEEAPVQ